jgi:hypothetical protein
MSSFVSATQRNGLLALMCFSFSYWKNVQHGNQATRDAIFRFLAEVLLKLHCKKIWINTHVILWWRVINYSMRKSHENLNRCSTKNISAVYRNRSFIIVYVYARHSLLSWAKWNKSRSHTVSIWVILILHSHLNLDLDKCPFQSRFLRFKFYINSSPL